MHNLALQRTPGSLAVLAGAAGGAAELVVRKRISSASTKGNEASPRAIAGTSNRQYGNWP